MPQEYGKKSLKCNQRPNELSFIGPLVFLFSERRYVKMTGNGGASIVLEIIEIIWRIVRR